MGIVSQVESKLRPGPLFFFNISLSAWHHCVNQTANHTYVDLTLVGNLAGEGIQCRTDLSTCCSSEGEHRANWSFPDGTRLPFPGSGDVYFSRQTQRVELRRTNDGNSPSGIYRCVIPTNAVNDETDLSVGEYLYAGVYPTGGDSGEV